MVNDSISNKNPNDLNKDKLYKIVNHASTINFYDETSAEQNRSIHMIIEEDLPKVFYKAFAANAESFMKSINQVRSIGENPQKQNGEKSDERN